MQRRILYFCPYMQYGGTERHLYNLLLRISREFEVMVSAPDGPLTPLLSEKVDQLVPYPGPVRVSLSEVREALKGVRRLIESFKPDLIHVHASREMVWIARKITKEMGVQCPVVLTPHAYTGTFDFFLTWLYAKLADRVVAVSNAERVRLARFFPSSVRDERVVWIPNGTPLADEEVREVSGRDDRSSPLSPRIEDRSSQQSPRIDDDSPVFSDLGSKGEIIGTTSRLSKEKGTIHLLKAFAILSAEFPDCRLVIVGDGRLRKSLEQSAANLGITDRVRFTGTLDDPAPVVAEFDIYVSSSLIENLSVSIVEAMALGKPVVATRIGGTPDAVVHGDTGLLCKPANPQELAQCIRALLVSPDMRRRMGKSGRQRAVNLFSIRRMVDETVSLYRELLAAN